MAKKKSCEEFEMKFLKSEGFKKRVSVSIISFALWLCFAIVYLLFWSGGHSVVQGIGIIIVSVIVFIAINAAAWAPWGMEFAADNAELCSCFHDEMKDEFDKYIDERVEERLKQRGKK